MLVLILDDVKAFLMDKSFMLLGGLFGQLCDLRRLACYLLLYRMADR